MQVSTRKPAGERSAARRSFRAAAGSAALARLTALASRAAIAGLDLGGALACGSAGAGIACAFRSHSELHCSVVGVHVNTANVEWMIERRG